MVRGEFPFSDAEFPFMSTEFPFCECRILSGLCRAPLQSSKICIFGAQNFDFDTELQFLSLQNLHFLSAEFPFSECGNLEGVERGPTPSSPNNSYQRLSIFRISVNIHIYKILSFYCRTTCTAWLSRFYIVVVIIPVL